MNYSLLTDMIEWLKRFEQENLQGGYSSDIHGFKQWWLDQHTDGKGIIEPDWENKEKGRSAESMISTLLVHMNRYAKNYARSAIHGSDFSTQEEFFYLINLRSFGAMSKMKLIRKNIQDKPSGMQVINRLLQHEWILQQDDPHDKRSKLVSITEKGLQVLGQQMEAIRKATRVVSGDLSHSEKMELIRILNKLDHFHKPIFEAGIENAILLERVEKDFMSGNN